MFTISNASTVTWHFAQQYELALDTVSDGTTSGVPGSITGSSTGWYASGSSITLTAAPLPEFRFAGWFGDVPAATAILDRFLQHAEIIHITGKSYRLKDRAAPAKAAVDKKGN